MGFLSKLFGGSTPSRPSVSGQISVYKVAMQQGGVSSQRCGIDGRTFPSMKNRQTIMTASIGDWALDMGGYCSSCGDYRCHEHAEFKGDGMTYAIVCARCGTELRPGP